MIYGVILATVIAGYDWVGFSIETDKRSEAVFQRYFHSEDECRNSRHLIGDPEDRVCFPVPTLPAQVWAAQNAADSAVVRRRHELCILNAESSWTEASRIEALEKCKLLPRQ